MKKTCHTPGGSWLWCVCWLPQSLPHNHEDMCHIQEAADWYDFDEQINMRGSNRTFAVAVRKGHVKGLSVDIIVLKNNSNKASLILGNKRAIASGHLSSL